MNEFTLFYFSTSLLREVKTKNIVNILKIIINLFCFFFVDKK